MEPDILPRRPQNVVSRKVEDYHFDNEVSKRRFEESIPLREVLPVIVRRIVSELSEKGKVLIWVTGAWGWEKLHSGSLY